ncbi:NAD(P)-binding domain-containing protein [filamentous cyanobacterium LEGE 07170]|nr:NAD(P)-binding domain-containing protein [filamentous cyanobacterium LEGE 07170]
MKIGIIGAGDVGQTLAELWIQAGHTIILSSRHPETLSDVLQPLGSSAKGATVAQAAAEAEILLLAVSYWTVDEAIAHIAPHVDDKIVIDATNPLRYAEEGGTERVIGDQEIAGLVMANKLPNARIVKAFTTLWTGYLKQHAHRQSPQIAMPLAGAKADTSIVADLIQDAGFEPVDLGTLADSRPLDPPSAIWNQVLTADELRARVARTQ